MGSRANDPADTVLVIQHQQDAGPGWLADALDDAGVPYEVRHPYAGQPLPPTVTWRGIVPLGGAMGAYETGTHRFLRDEMAYLRAATAAGTPILGICLGAQLLAGALGGRAHPAPSSRVGYATITLTPAGERDPVLSRVGGGPFLVWHGDTFDLPPGAELLATSDGLPYAFRVAAARGVQFHPEASPQLVETWMRNVDEGERRRTGLEPDELHREALERARTCRRLGHAFFHGWIEETR